MKMHHVPCLALLSHLTSLEGVRLLCSEENTTPLINNRWPLLHRSVCYPTLSGPQSKSPLFLASSAVRLWRSNEFQSSFLSFFVILCNSDVVFIEMG